ncbi:MAG: AEC family transporter [Clostridia bacterium]|nr:AEC family transporter [Clostridia bacterium]
MSYLARPISYVLIIALGYTLKRAGFLSKADQQTLSKVMFNITLPCTIIQGFSGFERDTTLFFLVGIGFLCALTPMLLMYLTTRGVETRLRAYRMLNIGGYNVGCFSLPLLEAFFGSACVVPAFMFDTGNAVMMTGGSYALTSTLLKTGGETREGVRDILLKFLRSLPFDTYMIMFAMVLLNIEMPELLFTLTKPAGQANGFLAMLIIGLLFEPVMDKRLIRETVRELACRYAFAAASAAACYFLTPFAPVVRQTLAVLCFAPLSSLAPIYTGRCHGDTALAGFTNSVSIAVSLVCMMALSMYFVM